MDTITRRKVKNWFTLEWFGKMWYSVGTKRESQKHTAYPIINSLI